MRRGGLTPAGRVVQETLEKMGLDHKTREHRTIILWPEIVGAQIAAATRVERVREGVLYVACRNSSWANELMLHRQEILKRVAGQVGEGIIADIRFSGRGFRGKAAEKEEPVEPVKELKDRTPVPHEVEKVEAVVAAVGDDHLAEVVRRALLTAWSREPPTGSTQEEDKT